MGRATEIIATLIFIVCPSILISGMRSIAKLQYFVGKVCTVFTNPVNRNLPQESPQDYLQQVFGYFLGRVESVDEDGVLLSHVHNGQKSFWTWHNLVGLAEEKELDEKKDSRVIQQLKENQIVQPKEPPKSASPYIDANKMAEMVKKFNSQGPVKVQP